MINLCQKVIEQRSTHDKINNRCKAALNSGSTNDKKIMLRKVSHANATEISYFPKCSNSVSLSSVDTIGKLDSTGKIMLYVSVRAS